MTAREEDFAARLNALVFASARLMDVLERARALALPEWLLASGAIYQTVWNHLTGRSPDYGIKDFDLLYFDSADLSYAGEDRVIARAAAAFPKDLASLVQVRNQARVHLWFEQKFGEPYTPVSSAAEALRRFVTRSNAVGVRLLGDNSLHIEAPYGLEDVFALRLRSPPAGVSAAFGRVAAELKSRWPEVSIESQRNAKSRSCD